MTDPILDREVDAAGFNAIKATQPFTKIKRPVWWWLEHTNIDSAGVPYQPVNTSGQHLVTEASAATINTRQTYINNQAVIDSIPMFGSKPYTSDGAAEAAQHKIFNVLLTSDGAGAVAATAIVPALAGYTGHLKWHGIWFDSTDAATTLTWSVAAGTILGPAVHVVATTASSVTQAGANAAGVAGCPVFLRGTIAADDNKAIQLAVAGYAATSNMWVFGEYWYET